MAIISNTNAHIGSNGFAYGYSNPSQSFWSRLAEKSRGWLYGLTENTLRDASLHNDIPYNAAISGAATHYLVDMLYRNVFGVPEHGIMGNYHATPKDTDNLSFMTPLVTKEVFVKAFHNDFVNNNRFYVEFIREVNKSSELLQPKNKAVLSTKNIKYITTPQTIQDNDTIMGIDTQYQVLLNYMVDSVQFPNFTSKKSTISRLGQDFTFVNNQQYEPNLTINFTYDMRGNIDRFLHYMAEYSKYYNNTRQNKFKIRVTSYKPVHIYSHDDYTNHGNPYGITTYDEFKINTKTFENIQLDSMQNYSVDNKQQDFLSRAITFTFQGLKEESYDNIPQTGFIDKPSLAYDMYTNFYDWLKTETADAPQ